MPRWLLRTFYICCALIATYVVVMTLRVTLDFPLSGYHAWRQSDTLYMGYFFCFEDANILYPRIGHRGATNGVSVGELPLYSWLLSLPCQLTGQWYEGLGRWWSLLLFAFTAWGWKSFAEARGWIRDRHERNIFLAFFVLSPMILSHMVLVIPDVLALGFMGWGLYFTASRRSLTAGIVLQVLAFWMRPYFAPLVFLNPWSLALYAGLGISFVAVYLGWYRFWAPRVSAFEYFNIQTKTLEGAWTEVLARGPAIVRDVIGLHFQLIFLPALLLCLKNRRGRKLIALWLFALIFVLSVSGGMFYFHKYYLGAATLMAVICIYWGLRDLPLKWRYAAALVWMFMSFANNQHIFHRPDFGTGADLLALAKAQTVDSDRIAMRSSAPTPFYQMKRKGFWIPGDPAHALSASDCPTGATHFYGYNEQEQWAFLRCN